MADMIRAGKSLEEASKVAIMIHGRGASAENILSLGNQLSLDNFALIAPQAPGGTWYPYSFMAPDTSNEPAFSNAIQKIDKLVKSLFEEGFYPEQIYLIGFSQGACLSLEYAAQNPMKFGGVIAFTGGLIGEQINPEKYHGEFKGASIFIGASKQDMHVPLSRIKESAQQLEKMGAEVNTLIFNDTQHTIRQEEVDWVNEHILK